MEVCKGRMLGISVAVAHGVFSGSLNILLKFLISTYHFSYLTLIQFLTSITAAITLEILRRTGVVNIPAPSWRLARVFAGVCALSTLQSTLTLWTLRGLSLPMYVVFKRCLPLATLAVGVCVLRDGAPSPGVIVAVLITTGGAALAGAGDLHGDPFGYVTGILAVIIHASYLVLIQKTSVDSEHGPLTAQYIIALIASPVLLVCSLVSMDGINMWTYDGWKNPFITGIFCVCVIIGCAMNFTTLHCTYINSAVTTSFVGVVKSIATITVGMLAFSDVEPTKLFIAGVVVNTVGSITYCVVKYFDAKKKLSYQDMDEAVKDQEPPGEPYVDPTTKPDGDVESFPNESQSNRSDDSGLGPGSDNKVTESIELQKNSVTESENENQTTNNFAGVLRSVRTLTFLKKGTLLDNMEVQSP